MPKNPQVIENPFDDSLQLVNIPKVTRSNLGSLECFCGWGGPTETNRSTRARGVSARLMDIEIREAYRFRRRSE